MAKQRIINTRFWNDNYTSQLDPIEKLLFLYLLTNTYTNISGIYEIPLKIIAVDTGVEKDMVDKILKRFERDKKCLYRDGWVIIVNWPRHQNLNPKVIAGILREVNELPEQIKQLAIDYGYPIDSLSHLTKLNLTKLNTNTLSSGSKKPEPDHEVKIFIDHAFLKFKEKTGEKLCVDGKKDGAIVKKLLRTYGLEKLTGLWDAFMQSDDPFIRTAGYSVGVFKTQINKLLSQKGGGGNGRSGGIQPPAGKYANIGKQTQTSAGCNPAGDVKKSE